MTKENMELLDEVIKNRLEQVQYSDAESKEDIHAFKEAMEALSKRIELEKIEASHQEQIRKIEIEKERNLHDDAVKVEEAKKDRWLQIALFAGGAVIVPIVGYVIDRSNMKALCNFEKDYTFTTSFGRGFASKLSRFKR